MHKLRTLWSKQYIFPFKIRILLANSLLFANCEANSKQKLKFLYNNIIRYVYELGYFDHITPYNQTLYGISFDNLLNHRSLLSLHKIIYTQKPNYLNERIQFTRSSRGRRIRPVRYHCLVSEYHFFVKPIRLWNALPRYLQIFDIIVLINICNLYYYYY